MSIVFSDTTPKTYGTYSWPTCGDVGAPQPPGTILPAPCPAQAKGHVASKDGPGPPGAQKLCLWIKDRDHLCIAGGLNFSNIKYRETRRDETAGRICNRWERKWPPSYWERRHLPHLPKVGRRWIALGRDWPSALRSAWRASRGPSVHLLLLGRQVRLPSRPFLAFPDRVFSPLRTRLAVWDSGSQWSRRLFSPWLLDTGLWPQDSVCYFRPGLGISGFPGSGTVCTHCPSWLS